MDTRVDEIADGIYRLSTFVPEIGPTGFTFNQFLIDDEQPLLFHTGPRGMFSLVSEAIAIDRPDRAPALDHLRPRRIRRVRLDEPVPRCRARGGGRARRPRVHGVAQRPVPTGRRGRSRTVRCSSWAPIASVTSTRPTYPTAGRHACCTTRRRRRSCAGDLFIEPGQRPAPLTTNDIVAAASQAEDMFGAQLPDPATRHRRSADWPSSPRHDRRDARLVVQWRRCRRPSSAGERLRGAPDGDVDPRHVTVVLAQHAGGT